MPIITTTASRRAKDYIRQVGLNYAVPSLNKNSHSVLYNPATGQYIDLRKSPQNKQVYENIFNVVNGL